MTTKLMTDAELDAELAKMKEQRKAREGGDDPSATPTLPTIWAEDLERQPVEPRKWIINEILPAGAVSGFYGPGAVGKDTILMQLATAGISGRKWFGFDVNARKFVYVNVEDDVQELRRREHAIAAHYGIRFRDFPNRWKLIPLADQDAVIAVFDRASGLVKPTPLFDALKTEVDKFEPDVVIVGNRVNLFSVDQNSDAQAQQCIRLLARLTTPNGRAVLMPAHPSRSGMSTGTGESGSVQWMNGVRAQVYLDRKGERDGEADDDARQLTLKKTNYGPLDKKIAIRWFEGVFVIDTGVPPPHVVGEDERRADQIFLMMLDTYNAEGRPVSGSPQARNNAPKVFSDDRRCPLRSKASKTALKHAMDRLFGAGEIVNRPYGSVSKGATCLARRISDPASHTASHTLLTPSHTLLAHTPHTPLSERAPAEGGRARSNGGGADEGKIVL